METFNLDIVKKIHNIFKSRKFRLSIAESCTGGLVSHLITDLPGASEFFDSAIICYSSDSKNKLLDIDAAILERYGSVSEESACAMADSVRKKTNADFALAITGNLGPVPIEDKETGLIYFAVSFDGGFKSRKVILKGSRQEIKLSASLSALEFLYEVVSVWT